MIVHANLSGIQSFCLAYELGNFTEAAKSLGVSPQAVSRAIGRLEQDLGVTLFRRNTRHIHATEHGRLYYDATRDALQRLADAERELLEVKEELEGTVRVSVPTTYGHHRFLPWMSDFQREHPAVQIDIQIAHGHVDFIKEGFDLAICMGEVKKDNSYIARKLGDFSLGVFASPTYIKEHGEPTFPMELEQHRCIPFVRPSSDRILPWEFSPDPEVFIPPSSLRVRHDVLGLVTLAKAGAGFIQLYHFIVEQELARGELVEVLQAYGGTSRSFSLLYPTAQRDHPAAKKLIEFIMERSLRDPRRS